MRQSGARYRRSCLNPVHGVRWYLAAMIDRRLFDELGNRIDEALRNSPAHDLQKNLRALLAGWFDRMDLVLREDFEVQKKLLDDALARLAALEARLAELESRKRAP
jgi:ubiquinone biosynthesis accessory factor UbiK